MQMEVGSNQWSVASGQWLTLVMLFSLNLPLLAEDLTALVRDRTAIEQVYYNHRLGQKPPFEQVSPPSTIERLVRQDLRKEAALKKVYGVEITLPMLAAEVQRINSTTRAPDTLAELKAALAGDPDRFARAVARPIVVERLLRDKFQNDDALHAAARRACESVRAGLLAARTNGATAAELLAQLKRSNSNAVTETTWQLTPRPAETNAPAAEESEVRKRFGPNAQLLSSPEREKDGKFFLEDLPADLQRVLRAQLRQTADVSAVIETPDGFLLYLAGARSDTALQAACLSLPKRSYEQWLEEQNGGDQ
jgi:hypothetical protein